MKKTPCRWRHYGLALLCAISLLPAQAATLFAVVTERAAPTAIEAAHRHLASHPGDRIVLRTPAQLMAADEKQLGQWISKADSIMAVSVFGDPARRLKDSLGKYLRPQTPILAINGEASLNLMSRDSEGSLLNFPAETLRQLALGKPARISVDRSQRPADRPSLAGRPTHLASWWQRQHAGPVRPPAQPAPTTAGGQTGSYLAPACRSAGTERRRRLG